MDAAYDATIAIVADEELRAARARRARARRRRRTRGAPALAGRKAARATYSVRNDGTDAELESELAVILEQLNR